MFSQMFSWIEKHDLPNTVLFFVDIVFVPLIVYLWYKRNRSSIQDFSISFFETQMKIGENDGLQAVQIKFVNTGDEVVYLKNVRITDITSEVEINKNTDINTQQGCVLLFSGVAGNYSNLDQREVILKQNQETFSGIALEVENFSEFRNYKTTAFKRTKYFNIRFTAMVGTKKMNVKIRH